MSPLWPPPYLTRLAKSIAPKFGLSPLLVCCVIEQESSWLPTAKRFESVFKVKYVDKLLLPEPEATYRATSWGLMQLMGQTAREVGFSGDLTTLLDPETGIAWGCRKLEWCMKHSNGAVIEALLKWNGEANQKYPYEVLNRDGKYKIEEAIQA